MALLGATMGAPTEALLLGMTAVTGEGNSPYITYCADMQFRPRHCMCDLCLHALHAVVYVSSGTLYGCLCAAFMSVYMYDWQLPISHYTVMAYEVQTHCGQAAAMKHLLLKHWAALVSVLSCAAFSPPLRAVQLVHLMSHPPLSCAAHVFID